MNETEYAVWEVLEPYLESHIHLDLNEVDESAAFREMVKSIAESVFGIPVLDSERQAIAVTIDNLYDDYQPVYNAEGAIVSSNIADAVSRAAVSESARMWKGRAERAESVVFRTFGYLRGAAGRVFRQSGEEMTSLVEYAPTPRLYRVPYQVTVDGKSDRFRTKDEAVIEASDARNDNPDSLVTISERGSDGHWASLEVY